MTARSGYLLDTASMGNSNITSVHLVKSLLPYIVRPIVLTNPGTLTHMEFRAYRVGTPVNFDVLFWRQNTGNPYTVPATANNWEIVARATIDASSITQTSAVNAAIIRQAVSTPVYLEDFVRKTDHTLDYQGYAFGYAATFEQTTAAQSNDDAANCAHLVKTGRDNVIAGFHFHTVNTTYDQLVNSAYHGAGLGLYGHYSVSTVYKDISSGVDWGATQTSITNQFVSGTNSSGNNIGFFGAYKFSVVGSAITRVAFRGRTRGTRNYQLICNIYTDDVSTRQPNTVIGSSLPVWTDSLQIQGTLQGAHVPLFFPFPAGGVAITSGNNYWFVLRGVNSVQPDTTSHFVNPPRFVMTTTPNAAFIRAQTAEAVGNWALENNHLLVQYWFADSLSQSIYDIDWTSSVGGGGGQVAGTKRTFPIGGFRRYPTPQNRENYKW
jgi:hypothetical protein